MIQVQPKERPSAEILVNELWSEEPYFLCHRCWSSIENRKMDADDSSQRVGLPKVRREAKSPNSDQAATFSDLQSPRSSQEYVTAITSLLKRARPIEEEEENTNEVPRKHGGEYIAARPFPGMRPYRDQRIMSQSPRLHTSYPAFADSIPQDNPRQPLPTSQPDPNRPSTRIFSMAGSMSIPRLPALQSYQERETREAPPSTSIASPYFEDGSTTMLARVSPIETASMSNHGMIGQASFNSPTPDVIERPSAPPQPDYLVTATAPGRPPVSRGAMYAHF